ncbi:uncharacterized protein EAE97_010637 [Botrytis byssoidea]|uniref:Uncharacterized protein n=1 Tax=Botrytis byssoidea TaxID=139641 RepID=A0A9P5HVR0_9HELO|nr:uncharacterized protein EAE97_010637 [Botrytis byssoidea]KAF7924686.1 hypothetical protein EAE97_010637 [Botrytis byssoidea]
MSISLLQTNRFIILVFNVYMQMDVSSSKFEVRGAKWEVEGSGGKGNEGRWGEAGVNCIGVGVWGLRFEI